MESWSTKQVLDSLSTSGPGSPTHTRAMAEIRRRTMEVDQASLRAQQKSADAAKSSRLSARYALGAVIVSAISHIVSIASYFRK